MNRMMLTLGAAASALTLSVAPALADEAPRHSGKVTYTECRKSSGTTGLAIGGVAGALIGGGIFGGVLGPLIGAAGGAFAGRAIDRDSTKAKRCRSVREERTEEQTYHTDRPNYRYESGRSNEHSEPSTYQAPSSYREQNSYDNRYDSRSERPIREEDRDLVQPERS